MTTQNLEKQDPQTRRTLIEAGIKLIAEKGYDGASIGDIAAYADVTKGAVYYHFGSKEDFVIEIIQQRSAQNIERFKAMDKENISLAEWIEKSFTAIIGFPEPEHQQFSLQVMMVGMHQDQKRIGELVAQIHAEWRKLITEMVCMSEEYRNGQVTEDPEVIAVGIMALIDGLLIHSHLEPESFTEHAFIKRLAPLLRLWVLQS